MKKLQGFAHNSWRQLMGARLGSATASGGWRLCDERGRLALCQGTASVQVDIPEAAIGGRPGRGEEALEQSRIEFGDGDAGLVPDSFGSAGEAGCSLAVAQMRGYADGQRAVLLGGERVVRLAADVADAQVTISYTVTMGARHPADARYTMSEPEGWDGAVVAGARQAHRTALAAATAAVAVIEAETNASRYRLRAVRDRWVPRLSRALTEVEFALEEQERADAARLRMSRRRPTWKD